MKNTLTKESSAMKWIAVLSVLFSYLLWASAGLLSDISLANWPNLSTALVTASAVLFALSSAIAWHVFNKNRQPGSAMVAFIFVCIAALLILHVLLAHDTSLDFGYHSWLISQGVVASTLLLLALRPYGKLIYILGLMLVLSLVVSLSNSLFFTQGITISPTSAQFGRLGTSNINEIILIVINLAAAALVYRQNKVANEESIAVSLHINKAQHFFACLLLAMAALHLTPGNMENVYDLMGKIFLLLATITLFHGMLTINFLVPFAALSDSYHQLQLSEKEQAIHKQRLTGIIETAIDGIITIDEKHKIVMANPAAAAIFGYSVETLLSAGLDSIIPIRHRKNHGSHVYEFGQTGVSKRKMGRNFEDFYITGLRSDGTELPIEASISSSIENGLRFFTVIFRDITDRKAAKEKMALYHTQLSQLSAALQSIREEERKHIARELHDDLGQLLAALRMDLSLLHRDTQMTEKSGKILNSMDQLILASITTLRRIATDLRPRALDEGGLFFALKTLQKDFSSRHGIDCELLANEELLILDDAHSTAIFRIVQESLTNVVRHAGASEVQIEFHREASALRFTIRDNGRGIEQEDMQKSQSFGLVGMRERIKAMQGELTITSALGEGTSLEIQIPLQIEQTIT